MKLNVQCTNGKYINIDVERIEREDNFVNAYRQFMGESELVAIIDLASIDYLYISEAKT